MTIRGRTATVAFAVLAIAGCGDDPTDAPVTSDPPPAPATTAPSATMNTSTVSTSQNPDEGTVP